MRHSRLILLILAALLLVLGLWSLATHAAEGKMFFKGTYRYIPGLEAKNAPPPKFSFDIPRPTDGGFAFGAKASVLEADQASGPQAPGETASAPKLPVTKKPVPKPSFPQVASPCQKGQTVVMEGGQVKGCR